MIGESLGPYKILEPLGAGGMGEVYLGEDTRLGRKVAIKVLPEEFAGIPDRLARFEQEARAAAALNHPHIAAIYDVGAEKPDGEGLPVHFIVQEHLEGETIQDKLKPGRVPVKQALKLAVEISEGLAAAHGAGIVHRDLKPANVFITQDGHAKILDFGLAKLVEPDLPDGERGATGMSASPTMLGTVAGQVMGTAGYMSPEQVNGDEVDARSDVFAFGCVLYEMACGRQAFVGDSPLDTLHRITHSEPAGLQTIDPELPAELARIITKCLAKDARDRYQATDDVVVDLRALRGAVDIGTAVPLSRSGVIGVGSETKGRGVSLPVAATAAVLLSVLSAASVWISTRTEAPPSLTPKLFEVQPAPGGSFPQRSVAVSPRGQFLVYARNDGQGGGRTLYLRRLDRPDSEIRRIELPHEALQPFFKPDESSIGYIAVRPADEGGNFLAKVPIDGGPHQKLCECVGAATWSDTGVIYFASGGQIWSVPDRGGEPTPVLAPENDAERYARPQVLPGGRVLVFEVALRGAIAPEVARSIAAASLEPGNNRVVQIATNGTDPRWAASGHVVFARGTDLFSVPFDPGALQATGEPAPVLSDVRVNLNNGAAPVGLGLDGTLAFLPTGELEPTVQRELVWVNRQGVQEPAYGQLGHFRGAKLSPDGRLVAVERETEFQGEIWILDLIANTFAPIFNEGSGMGPLWTPDSKKLVFNWALESGFARQSDIYVANADFTGTRDLVFESELGGVYPISWGKEGELLLHHMIEGQQRRRILAANLDVEEQAAQPILDQSGQFNHRMPLVSPDGNLLMYVSTEAGGRDEVFVRPYPQGGSRDQVSDNGGTEPMWGKDSSEIFYYEVDTLMRAQVEFDDNGEMSVTREPLFDGSAYFRQPLRIRTMYDYDRTNDRFLMVDTRLGDTSAAGGPRITVIVNWFEELKERVPTGR